MPKKVQKVRWEEIQRVDLGGGWDRASFANDKAQLVFNWMEPGAGSMEPHVHDFDQFALFLEGEAVMVCDGVEYSLRAGDMLFIPAGVWHCGEGRGEGRTLNLDIFCPPREDYAYLNDWQKAGADAEEGSAAES